MRFLLELGRFKLELGGSTRTGRPTILLVRHGQSEANVDRSLYTQKPDYLMSLTDRGHRQAKVAGTVLVNYFNEYGWPARVRIFHSEYLRAMQTAHHIMAALHQRRTADCLVDHKVDPRSHELEFGLFTGMSEEDQGGFRGLFPSYGHQRHLLSTLGGKYYDRRLGGESPADVDGRLRNMFGAIYRDYHENGITHFVVVAHGLTNRVFVKGWCQKDMFWYHDEDNPHNCAIRLLEDGQDTGYIHHGGSTGLPGEEEEAEPTEHDARHQPVPDDIKELYDRWRPGGRGDKDSPAHILRDMMQA